MSDVINIKGNKNWLRMSKVLQMTGWTYTSAYNKIVTQKNITHRTEGGIVVCLESLNNYIEATTVKGRY